MFYHPINGHDDYEWYCDILRHCIATHLVRHHDVGQTNWKPQLLYSSATSHSDAQYIESLWTIMSLCDKANKLWLNWSSIEQALCLKENKTYHLCCHSNFCGDIAWKQHAFFHVCILWLITDCTDMDLLVQGYSAKIWLQRKQKASVACLHVMSLVKQISRTYFLMTIHSYIA